MRIIENCEIGQFRNSCAEFGRDAFEQVIAGRTPRVTAILATSVPTAIGVMHATYEHGLTIPRDLSIIACDNPPETQYLNPSLTAIDFPSEKLSAMPPPNGSASASPRPHPINSRKVPGIAAT